MSKKLERLLEQQIELLERQNALLGFLTARPPNGERWCGIVHGPCWQHGCEHYLGVLGKDPQKHDDAEVSPGRKEFGCAISWNVVVEIEGNQEVRKTASEVEKLRNEMVERMDAARQLPQPIPVRLRELPNGEMVMVPLEGADVKVLRHEVG